MASLSLNDEDDYFFFDIIELSIMNLFFNLKSGCKIDAKYLDKLGKYL